MYELTIDEDSMSIQTPCGIRFTADYDPADDAADQYAIQRMLERLNRAPDKIAHIELSFSNSGPRGPWASGGLFSSQELAEGAATLQPTRQARITIVKTETIFLERNTDPRSPNLSDLADRVAACKDSVDNPDKDLMAELDEVLPGASEALETNSIDSLWPLHEMALPDWSWTIDYDRALNGGPHCHCYIYNNEPLASPEYRGINMTAAAPAQAWLAAILKALAESPCHE